MYKRPSDASPHWHVAVAILSSVIPALIMDWARVHNYPTVAAVAGLALILPIILIAHWWGARWGGMATALASLYLIGTDPGSLSISGTAIMINGALIILLIERHRTQHNRDITEMERVRQDAMRDDLTGLMNWHRFKQSVTTLLHQFPSHPLSLVMIDIDNFKIYNDTFGHVAGDRLLVEVAQIITQEISSECLPFRYGGEEFAVLLPNFHTGQAIELAERLRNKIEQSAFAGAGRMPKRRLTVSVGVASFPVHAQYPEQLIERADEALYQAKEAGRNCVFLSEVTTHKRRKTFASTEEFPGKSAQ